MYNQREIVLVPFPYSDLSFSKRRPVLVISNNYYNKNFPDIFCVITSNLFKDAYSVDLNDEHLESGVLPEKSIIKRHKLFTVEQTKIIRRFSVISEQKFDEIINMLQKLINKSN